MDMPKFVGVEISKTNNILKRKCRDTELSREIDEITGKSGWIIGYLAENDDKDIFQKDIEERFSVRRSTVSSMLKLMEKKGLVTRESVNFDARLKKLVLTPKAMEMHCRMLEQLNMTEKKLKRGITEEELDIFFGVLEKIRKNAE